MVRRRPWRVQWMYDCAPDVARRIEYKCFQDQFGQYDLLGVACRDWGDPDCQVWVYIQTGQFLRAHEAACAAESAAVLAVGYYAAAEAACQAAYAAAGADAAALDQASKAAQAAEDASAEAVQAALDAHHAARETHRYARDDDRAAEVADAASAAAERAAAARDAALASSQEAEAAALEAGVDPAVLVHKCGNAEDDARYRACRDFPYCRGDREPRWRPTEHCAGRFGHDWYRALKELAAEYL
jgi:hypothetical protein